MFNGFLDNKSTPPTGAAQGNSARQASNAPPVSPMSMLTVSNPFKDLTPTDSQAVRISQLSPIVHTVNERYQRAKEARRPQELIWLRNMHQWRGEYDAGEQARIAVAKARSKEASDVFIKITKTKTCAALGQIEEILFAGNRFPIGVEAPPEPEGVAQQAFVAPEAFPDDPYGYNGDGQTLDPGATRNSLLGGLYEKYKQLTQGKKIVEGASPDPKQFPQINPAEESASNMQKYILTQLSEGKVMSEIRKLAWECCVLGTGVIKGPMTYSNVVHTWVREAGDDGKFSNVYKPKKEDVPRSFYVSIWNFYPDNNCSRIENAAYVCEKHLLNRWQVAELKKYPSFDNDAIERVLRNKAVRNRDYWENQIKDISVTVTDERYEVIEYWGYLEKEHLASFAGIEKDDLAKIVDQAQVNVWICGQELLRVVINPFVPERIPYYAVPYEEHMNQIWGISIPENMRDPQKMMNGHWRMMIDNLRFAGSVILEVNENQLVPGQDLTIHPGKIFRKQGGAPGQSIYSISVNNTAPAHIQAFDKARQLADEATGQPSYSYGQSGISGTTRTAAGMSMLMSAAAGNIKQVIRNFDEYLLEPLGQAYFNWNMQFNEDASVEGAIKIVAKGTTALMQKEVQSQRLLQFLQIVSSNQLLTPFANLDYILKQIALSLDLDPDKMVNDATNAALFAQIIGQLGQASGAQPPQQGPQAPGQGSPSPEDQTGGGGSNIGVGAAAQPGDSQFSGGPPSQTNQF